MAESAYYIAVPRAGACWDNYKYEGPYAEARRVAIELLTEGQARRGFLRGLQPASPLLDRSVARPKKGKRAEKNGAGFPGPRRGGVMARRMVRSERRAVAVVGDEGRGWLCVQGQGTIFNYCIARRGTTTTET